MNTRVTCTTTVMMRPSCGAINNVLQIVSAAFWFNFFTYVGIFSSLLLMVKLLLSKYWWIGVLYIIWIIFDDAPRKGGRTLFKDFPPVKFYREYFPVKLIKTVDLDPNKNYIFTNYPHGTFALGTFLATITNSSHFSKLFPGLMPRLMMHNVFYYVPFYREFILSLPTGNCSEESLAYVLNADRYKGICAIIVLGGAREGLESAPGKHRLIYNKRKGFIRVAMKTGASIVPLYSFGETDIFKKTTFDNKLLSRLQIWMVDNMAMMMLKICGRGPFGLIPLRKPLNVVVGAPLDIKKNPNPTTEEINAVHEEFKERLIQLFEAEKSKYIEDYMNTHLEFI